MHLCQFYNFYLNLKTFPDVLIVYHVVQYQIYLPSDLIEKSSTISGEKRLSCQINMWIRRKKTHNSSLGVKECLLHFFIAMRMLFQLLEKIPNK